ncbi:MAG: hypothetical protein ACOYLE_04075, partial [Bacteroidales bacterium]
PPTVTAQASATTVCSGTGVILTGVGTSGVVYTWDNGVTDGVSFNATTTTTYTVIGTLNGCQNTASITINVNPAPPVNPITGTAVLCAGTLNSPYSVQLHTYGQPLPPGSGHGSGDDQPDGAVNNYSWSYTGTGVSFSSTTGNAVTISYAPDATSGDLIVIETIPGGCSYTNILPITVNTLPIAMVSGSATINTTETATVTGATAINGTILWSHNGSGVLTNETTLTPTYTPVAADAGNTVVLTMTVTNSCGSATATYDVNVIPSAYKVSGILEYNSDPNPNVPLSGYKVKLLSGSVVIDSVITDTSGYYEFNAVNGTYTIESEASPTAYWYADFDDVLAIYDYVVLGPPLPGENDIRLVAADVNVDNDINFDDVSALYDRIVNGTSDLYTAPDFVFKKPTVIVNNAAVIQHIFGLSSGNVYGTNTTP